jgi:hypothetical protein
MREEEVAAPAEAGIDLHLQALDGVGVEPQRFRYEQAVRRCPLLADAARLNAQRSGADAGAAENGDGRPALDDVKRDRQPDDSGADDDHVRPRAHAWRA